MTFAAPLWLWALLLLPVLTLAEAWATRRDRDRTARLVSRALWDRVLRRPAERWRYLRLGLLLAGAAGVVVALARPQWGIVREKVEREGVDVVLVLDTSGSMATEDVAPNRFFLARAAVMNLVSRLEGDRFGLVAFEGEAYPLVPLTLDADAVGLFLESTEPGIVPGPGSSLGSGLAKGLELFADRDRRNKAMVLVSDGEDLEGDIDEAVRRAKEAGVVVHAVGAGTEAGQPVPDLDREGNRTGYKKDEDGSPVVSRLHPETLEAIARGTGGRYVRLSPADTGLGPIASAIEAMDRKGLVGEWSYRKKERFQAPLAAGIACLTLGLLLPPPSRRRSRMLQAAAVALTVLSPSPARAEGAKVWDEVTLRPRRLTSAGRKAYAQGDHAGALRAFEDAAASRPDDPSARFNIADGLYKSGKLDEAAALFQSLGADAAAPLAGPSRYNLGNTLFQKQDFGGAVRAYRDTLRVLPADPDARRNLELALRELKKQQEQPQQQQQQKQGQDQKQDQQQQQSRDQGQQKGQPRPQSEEEKEKERFQKETGMPKERAMQLLSALQQNEKDEQKKLLARKPAAKRKVKDW